MKKFSWIFALVLALSMAFIGCPSGGDEGESGGGDNGGGGGGGDGYAKNPKAQDISVTFGTGTGDKLIKKDGNNEGSIDPGTLKYINATGADAAAGAVGYEYSYTSGANTNYGNVILRFKIDLGQDEDGKDINLADYGKVSFDWQATAPAFANNNSVNSGKNLFLIASDSEADLTPYKDPKGKVISTNVFKDITPTPNWYDGSVRTNDPNVPQVNGLSVHHVEFPIIVSETIKYYEGEIWFAIYVHAEGGTYQIKNIKFWAGDQTATSDAPGTGAPPEPPTKATIPGDFVEIPLNLDVDNVSDVSGYGNDEISGNPTAINTKPTITAAGTGVKVVFDAAKSGQRLNVKLSNDDIATFKANADAKDVYVQIDYAIDGTPDGDGNYTGDLFRYHVGIISTSSNWNATDSLSNFALKDIAVSTANTGIKINASNKDRAAYFILQHQSADTITVTINSISIWVAPAPTVPTKTITFAAGDVKAHNADVTLLDAGVGYKVETKAGYDWTWTYFKVKFEDGYTLSDYNKIEYTTKGITVSAPSDWGTTPDEQVEDEEGDMVPKPIDLSGYKGGYMYVYPSDTAIEAITDPIPNDNIIFSNTTGTSATGISALDTDKVITVDIKTTLPTGTDLQEVWIAFRCGGTRGYTFELKNIKFYQE